MMNTIPITEKQARTWAKNNGFHKLPRGMNWQLCGGVQFVPEKPDAWILVAGDCGLVGIVGFYAQVAEEQAS